MQKVFMKWIRNTAVMLAVMTIGANTGLAQVTVELTQLVGRPGETGMVAVKLLGVEGETAIQSFGFDIESDAGVTFTGISTEGTLAGDAGFNTGTGLPAEDRVGGFAQGTDIETSGTLVYLMFDLDATSVGTVTLTNFLFNAGDPGVAWLPVGDVVVSDRMLNVEEVLVHEDDVFTVKVIVEDAFVIADGLKSFSIDVNYDPALFTIDKTQGTNGIITAGTLTGRSGVNGVDMGPGVYRVAGFTQSSDIIGDGVLFELAAIAGNKPGLEGPGEGEITLTNVQFNTGTPIYGAFQGHIIVYPFNVANEGTPETPSEFVLDGNYPNPFNPSTNIQFDLPDAAIVSVQVMDLLGREVMAIPAQNYSSGVNQTIQINAGSLTSGIYLYRVIAQTQSSTSVKVGTMTLLK
jgi:hypothetical protein